MDRELPAHRMAGKNDTGESECGDKRSEGVQEKGNVVRCVRLVRLPAAGQVHGDRAQAGGKHALQPLPVRRGPGPPVDHEEHGKVFPRVAGLLEMNPHALHVQPSGHGGTLPRMPMV